MVSLDAVREVSGYSREYLSALERGDGEVCVLPEVLLAYEQAIGVPVETEVLAMVDDFLHVLRSGHEMLARLYRYRVGNVQSGQLS